MKKIKLEDGIIKIPVDGTKLGIDALKSIVTHIGKIAEKIKKFKEDGKYSFWEKMQTGFVVVGGTIEMATEAGKIWKELQDLDQKEVHQLVMHFASTFKINTAKAELFVKKIAIPVLQMLEDGSQVVSDIDDVFGK